jgi:hypothetical protein
MIGKEKEKWAPFIVSWTLPGLVLEVHAHQEIHPGAHARARAPMMVHSHVPSVSAKPRLRGLAHGNCDGCARGEVLPHVTFIMGMMCCLGFLFL